MQIWLTQSVRTSIAAKACQAVSLMPHLISLGDAIHRPRLQETFFQGDLGKKVGVSGPVMLDSGGFTQMVKGKPILNVEDVAQIYSSCRADFFVALDLPLLPSDERSIRIEKAEFNRRSLSKLASLVPGKNIVPVVHGTCVSEIEASIRDIKLTSNSFEFIGIGGQVPAIRRSGGANGYDFESIGLAVEILSSEFPSATPHLFGAGAPKVLLSVSRLGVKSADSLAWRRAASFGAIYVGASSERYPTERHERKRPKSRPSLSPEERKIIGECECSSCSGVHGVKRRLEKLASNYMHRAIHNAHTIKVLFA